MKKEANDMLLREKLTALDPLSGGIVFGKEAAWEKLQARMEQKPARKMAVWYWAAAAMLLLLIGVKALYHTPANELAKAPVQNDIAPTTVAADHPIQATQPNEAPGKQNTVAAARTPIQSPGKPAARLQQNNEDIALPPEPKAPVIAVVSPAPPELAPPAPRPMNVYYIDDLERGDDAQPRQALAANDEHTDVVGLPTVHIQEVEREARDVKAILRENRMSIGHRIFSRQNDNSILQMQEATQPDEDGLQRNPLRSILNKQN